jgi:MFS family permease
VAWARADSIPAIYLAFASLGLAEAAVLYEPAYATAKAWFENQRQNALLTVTMVAGLASTIFVSAAAALIGELGWRDALLILALVQAATAIPHYLLLRRLPADLGWERDGIRATGTQRLLSPAARSAKVQPQSGPGGH